MNINFLRSAEKKKIIENLEEQFGITDLPYLLVESGKEKIRFFSGHLSKEEILDLSEVLNIELIGLYSLKQEGELRLTIDATNLLNKQLTKNIVELDDSNIKNWLRGFDLDIKTQKGTLLVKYKDYFLGCTKSNGEKLFNYVPKDRRLKK